jgi:hypothetical protein
LDPNFAVSPLRRAEHRGIERTRLADLSERSEFPRDPFDIETRRVKRRKVLSFGSVF